MKNSHPQIPFSAYHNPDKLTPDQVDPENEGWRLLFPEEIQYRNATPDIEGWELHKEWSAIPWRGNCPHATYRTKWPIPASRIPAPVNQWIAFSERQPTEGDLPIKACCAGSDRYVAYRTWPFPNGYSHWMRDITPPIPEKQKTQEELDAEYVNERLNRWLPEVETQICRLHVHKMLTDAIAYARKQP